jgi:hypothetical protein
MIRISTLLLTAALDLIMSAITAQAANTQLATTQAAKPTSSPISRLPYTIGAPGTYVVTGNLTCFTAGNAITINVTSPGTVILNLNGFTLYANPNIGAGPGDNAVAILNTNSPASIVTVKNGTIGGLDQGFGNGVSVNGSATGYLANVTVDHVNFLEVTPIIR